MRPTLFYDGSCVLCHGFVRWVVQHDTNAVFQFASLGGATFQSLVSSAEQAGLPDSVVVRDEDGRLFVGSDALIVVLRRVGYTGCARTLALLPRPVRDLGYRVIARVRYAIFGRKQEWCPVVPAAVRSRFLD